MITRNDLEYMKHPIQGDEGGRLFIGQIVVAEAYYRVTEPNLFTPKVEKWDFHISIYMKQQPEGKWLESVSSDEQKYRANTIEDGINWVLNKLNTK